MSMGNSVWRTSLEFTTLPLVCSSSLASLPKAAERSSGTFAEQGVNVSCHWEGMVARKYFCRASTVGIIDFCSLSLTVHCVYQFSCWFLIIAVVGSSTQGSNCQKLIKNYFCVMKWVLGEKGYTLIFILNLVYLLVLLETQNNIII